MEVTVKLENLSKSEKENLMALIEKSTKPKSKVWRPKEGEKFFYITSTGYICPDYATCEGFVGVDKYCWSLGNCYKTSRSAEFALQHRLVEAELQRFAEEHNEGEINWSDGSPKHRICYNYQIHKIEIVYFYYYHTNDVYFTSKK